MADDGTADGTAVQDGADTGTVYTQAEVDELVAGLKAKLNQHIGKSKRMADQLKAFEGLDPEAARAALERAAADGAGDQRGESKPDIDKLRAKIEADFKARYTPIEQDLEQTRQELRRLKVDEKVRVAALAAGVRKEAVDDAMAVTRGLFDLSADGKIIVLDEDGEPSVVPMDRFWSEKFRDAKPWFYESTAGSGTGATRGSTGKAPVITSDQIIDNLEGVATGKVRVAA